MGGDSEPGDGDARLAADRRRADRRVEAILAAVALIPRGRVLSYGDVAEMAGVGGPRLVGRILAAEPGADIPWHRVLRADGSCAAPVRTRQLALLRAEDVPMRGVDRDRVDMRAARWDGRG